MQTFKKYHYLLLVIGLLLISPNNLVSSNNKDSLPVPEIVNDSIVLSGIVVDERNDKNENPLEVTLTIYNPVSGRENSNYPILVNEHGLFELKVPAEINPSVATISSSIGNGILAYLVCKEKNFLEIRLDKESSMNFKLSNSVLINSYDMIEFGRLLMEMEDTYCDESDIHLIPLYDKSYDEYISTMSENIDCRIAKILDKNTLISESMKAFLKQELRLTWLNNRLFFYSQNISNNYKYTNSKEQWDNYIAPPEPDKHYYHFLSQLELNEKRNLYSMEEYNNTLDNILLNDILAIPEINDTSIDIWIKNVADVLGELVGFEEGFFYEQLAIRSFIRQFEDYAKPLTERQKQNIRNYFSNQAISEILFRENEKIEELAKYQSVLVINSTPNLPNEQLFEGILSKYVGSPVVVSFWATYCKPCIANIDKMKELKSKLQNKGIVFVYITDVSSRKSLWEKKVQGIGGDHYYLSKEQWNYILAHFDLDAIPNYLLFDKTGVLKGKMKSYPGNDEMLHQLDNL